MVTCKSQHALVTKSVHLCQSDPVIWEDKEVNKLFNQFYQRDMVSPYKSNLKYLTKSTQLQKTIDIWQDF
jgi:hypothetical protein